MQAHAHRCLHEHRYSHTHISMCVRSGFLPHVVWMFSSLTISPSVSTLTWDGRNIPWWAVPLFTKVRLEAHATHGVGHKVLQRSSSGPAVLLCYIRTPPGPETWNTPEYRSLAFHFVLQIFKAQNRSCSLRHPLPIYFIFHHAQTLNGLREY